MATSPPLTLTLTNLPLELRAPPPSPAAAAAGGGYHNDEIDGFLNRTVRVPQLVLPGRILNRRETAAPWGPPEIDMRRIDEEMVRLAARSGGCFKLVGHGIGGKAIERAGVFAGNVFRLPAEVKREVTRTEEREWGFEEDEEEILWWSDELAGILSEGHKDFRGTMQSLWGEMESIASKIELVLLEHIELKVESCSPRITTMANSIICLHKHGRSKIQNAEEIKHNILKMLVRSSVYRHSLRFHICRGTSTFCVYSKKGWIHFPVEDGTIVVTIGEHIQALSGGLYKHVIGKHIFQNVKEEEDPISIDFLYSPPVPTINDYDTVRSGEQNKMISLTDQVIIAACITFLYHIIMFYMFSST